MVQFAASFLEEWEAADNLEDRGLALNEDDERTILDLMVDSVEFANVIVINKTDLVAPGINMDEAALRARLDRCLLTDEEMAEGPDQWAGYLDPFPEWTMQESTALADAHH
ncbi:MAG: hypothetical protein EXQ51_05185 [Acidobacteria bacterium]|nr:hypothetical protein [Acidobacteriota bacterium]